MRKPSVYLAGPIDGVPPFWALVWRQEMKKRLPDWNVLDPTEGKDLYAIGINDTVYPPEYIVESDLEMIQQADVLLVDWRGLNGWMDEPLRVGTIMEMVYAKQMGKQVVTFGDLRRGYWLRYHADMMCDTMEEAVEYLVEVCGKKRKGVVN